MCRGIACWCGRMTTSCDRPASSFPRSIRRSPQRRQPNAPQPPAQQLETYPLTPASQSILAALEKQAAGRPDIRVAVDQRSSQVLVLAPNSIHAQIREKLAQAAAPPIPQAAPNVTPAQAWPGPSTAARPQHQDPRHQAPAVQAFQQPPTNGPLRLQNLRADDLASAIGTAAGASAAGEHRYTAASGRPLKLKRCRARRSP